MTDPGYVLAGWGVILGGLTLYAVTLLRRLDRARATSLRIRRQAEAAPLSASPAAPPAAMPGERG